MEGTDHQVLDIEPYKFNKKSIWGKSQVSNLADEAFSDSVMDEFFEGFTASAFKISTAFFISRIRLEQQCKAAGSIGCASVLKMYPPVNEKKILDFVEMDLLR